MIRVIEHADFEVVAAIECAAGEAFRAIGMATVADDPAATADELTAILQSGMGWVDTDHDDGPVAYLVVEKLDGRVHIEQVTVHPGHARRGIGAALIDKAAQWADEQKLDGLSLTTFVDVPWNAPYYSRLGFTVLPESAWSVGLQRRVARESANGLDAWPRVVMVRR